METTTFQRFLQNRGEAPDSDEWDRPRNWDDPDYSHPGAPVVGVSWFESRACAHAMLVNAGEPLPSSADQSESHCPWLPSETEWERAASWNAKNDQRQEYPWGEWSQNESPRQHCNIHDSGLGQISPVIAFPAGISPSGCYEMSGNVWEWQANWYDEDKDWKGLRGGAFGSGPRNARCAYRGLNPPAVWNYNGGFRAARTDF